MAKLATPLAELVPVDQLEAHPSNPRTGDVAVIGESIRSHGFYGAIVAQRSTRRILAGNHRWQAAKAEGIAEVPVMWLDVDDDEALRVLLVDNRSNDQAGYDDAQLAFLLEDLAASQREFEGTGYDDTALALLLGRLAGPPDRDGEWAGMPAYTADDLNSVFHCTVHFRSENDADAFFRLVDQSKRTSLWYPESDGHVGSTSHERYVDA